MAYNITDACVKCGACADQCPVEAISEGDDKYVIDADVCVSCGACADQCPGRAIPRATPQETDPLKCVQCGACIRICPMQARGYHSDGWKERAPVFAEKCAEYRKPETFFVK